MKAFISKAARRLACAFAALALAAPVFAAQDALLKVSQIKVGRQADQLVVWLDIDPRAVNPGRDKEVTFTPVVVGADGEHSLTLPQVKIAGRNRYYSHLRNHNLPEGTTVYSAGSDKDIVYRVEVPFEPWMQKCQVDMLQDLANCCESPKPGPATPLARLDYEPEPFVPVFKFVELTGDSAIELTAEGRAFIDFKVNRTEIKEGYRKNPIELPKIIASIDKVKKDPDATITKITIKGYASPEGGYENNVRLAMGRTAALKDFVRERFDFDPEIMHTDFEPEDWEGLREWVVDCTLPHREQILQIIDSSMLPDPKDHELKRQFPAEYQIMLDSVYPGLRHSDYTVNYRIRAYATVEELLEVFKTTPERMRPVDFQRIAALYPLDSPEYAEIMLKAVEIHPSDAKSNLNAATLALGRGDLAEAARLLDRAGESPEAVYTRGVMAGLSGDLDRAQQLFAVAAEAGLAEAQAAAEGIEAIVNKPTVEYLITPTSATE